MKKTKKVSINELANELHNAKLDGNFVYSNMGFNALEWKQFREKIAEHLIKCFYITKRKHKL